MESYQQNYTQPTDPTSMLEFLNPKAEIDDVLDLILGLQKKTVFISGTNSTRTVYRRVNKPIFTDEYARSIVSDLRSFLNYTVQVSRFDDRDIRLKCKNYLKKLLRSLCTHGDDAYISHNSWQKILDIHESSSYEKDGKKIYNGWDKFDIVWEYDKAVENEMLELIKDRNEEVDQAIVFDRIISTFGSVIHASFNKSFSPNPQMAGMLLGSMTQIRSESQIIKEAEKKGWTGRLFGRGGERNGEY